MYVKKLRLMNFRNHSQFTASFQDSPYLIFGENGVGKTNLLEAVFVVIWGTSPRTRRLQEAITFGEEYAYLEALLDIAGYEHKLQVTLEEGRRTLIYDNNRVKNLEDYRRGRALVTFAPRDLSLLTGSPTERRNFLDQLCTMADEGYGRALSEYHHSMRQKSYGLKHGLQENLLRVYNQRMARYGAAILRARLKMVAALVPEIQRGYELLSGGREKIRLQYLATIPISWDEGEMEAHLLEGLEASRAEERRQGRSLYGPHLDDISFLLGEREAKRFASTGQNRTVILSLKLAEIWLLKKLLDTEPVVLLDDVFSELDEERRRALIRATQDLQCFYTMAEEPGGLSQGGLPVPLLMENSKLLPHP
ncbi:MAG: DNA replication/repair protein RecF [Tissierellia bacterium]|nr:DNA replication/repair protein RecF [Tissierellia bacterium]